MFQVETGPISIVNFEESGSWLSNSTLAYVAFNNNKEESRKLYEFNQQNIDLINKYLIKGKKNITMIVSAARMPNLELRLQKQHFKIKTTTWQTAWASP